jgi:hypothetical protein
METCNLIKKSVLKTYRCAVTVFIVQEILRKFTWKAISGNVGIVQVPQRKEILKNLYCHSVFKKTIVVTVRVAGYLHTKKSKFCCIFEGLGMENFGIIYSHLVFFIGNWVHLWLLE